jgi:diguanylate cyclase (GGDEF)-like protein
MWHRFVTGARPRNRRYRTGYKPVPHFFNGWLALTRHAPTFDNRPASRLPDAPDRIVDFTCAEGGKDKPARGTRAPIPQPNQRDVMSFIESTQPVSPAFARRVRSAALLALLFATTLFAVFSHGLLSEARDDSLRSTAKMLAASISPGSERTYKQSLARAVREHDALVAVATLDAFGSISSIYPDRHAYRETVEDLLTQEGTPKATESPKDGTPCVLSAIAVPFGDRVSARTATLVAVMRVTSPTQQWLTAISMFTILVGAIAWFSTRSLYRWFDVELVDPLRRMADLVGDPEYNTKSLHARRFRRWRETAQIAERFQELRGSLEESHTRAKRLRRDAKQTLRECEVGFDRQLQHARFLAQTDPLTQLRNRAFLEENLDTVFDAQQTAKRALSAVMVDLDNFKAFNDALGHQVGDALLKFTGALLSGSLRPDDYAIRYGGDEFLLLLPDADAQQAAAIADRMIKMFGQYAKSLEKGNMVSMSAGVASIPEKECKTGLELIAAADKALYLAKRNGKGNVQAVSGTEPTKT